MEWKVTPKKEKPAPPKLGDKRNRKRFALFPVRTIENKWIWLKSFTAVQEWKKVLRYGEEVVSEGIITETVRCYTYLTEDWETIYKTTETPYETKERQF